jgi:membrane protein implicated in regulation of membrane protease activity
VRIWFWGWLVAAIVIAAASALLRDRASFPFAIGAAIAAAIEATGADPLLEWVAFAVTSCVVFAVVNRQRYRPRHLRPGIGRHGSSPSEAD